MSVGGGRRENSQTVLLHYWAGPAEGTGGEWHLAVKFVIGLRYQEVGSVKKIEQGRKQLGVSLKVTRDLPALKMSTRPALPQVSEDWPRSSHFSDWKAGVGVEEESSETAPDHQQRAF